MQSLFAPITELFRVILDIFFNITATMGHASYGVAIIIMTIVIKMFLYPLTAKQVKSMKAMQTLQPKLKELQERYKNNPKEMQEKLAALYRDSGINPLAGCLPVLIQMPILMGVYYSLYGLDYSGDAGFLWITNLSEADPIYILPILSALTTYITMKQSEASNQSGDNSQMKIMSYVMPLFIGWISLSFPAGLVLYWVTMNVVQVIQQWWIYRNLSEEGK